jgi:ketosteroid isomerase-like protein
VSQDNADVLREALAALDRGGVEAVLPYIDPEFEFTTPPNVSVEPDTYRGHDGLRRYFDSFYEIMDKVSLVPDEFIAIGDRVVVPMRLVARGRETGIESEIHTVGVWTLRDGKVTGTEIFVTLEEAMEAARGAA